MEINNEFIERYTPMVRMEVKRLGHEHLRDDLMQEGYYALIQSGRYYTEDGGEPFELYAARWIRRVVKKAIRTYGYPVSLPKHTEVDEGAFVSMDAAMEDDEGNRVQTDVTTGETAETRLLDIERRKVLEHALHTLSPREQDVIRLYYGIGCERMGSAEIGRQMGIRDGHIRIIKARALEKMQKMHFCCNV